MCVKFVICFLFKQKTAYEMRISDWSSDVCSSDLLAARQRARALPAPLGQHREPDEERLERPLVAAAPDQAQAQVLGDGEAGEDLASLRRVGDAEARDVQTGRASCRERVCKYE